MYGDNIPPENLEQMPMEEVLKNIKDDDALEDFLNTISYGDGLDDPDVLSKLLHENPQLEKRVERIADEEYGDIDIKGVDRPLVHELNSLTLPISERFVNSTKFIDEGLDRASQRIDWFNNGRYGLAEGTSPYAILRDELLQIGSQVGMNEAGDFIKKMYWKPDAKVSDVLKMAVAPKRKPDIYETVPGPGKIAKGSVSRGLEGTLSFLDHRLFDSKAFENLMKNSRMTPYEAAKFSAPKVKMNPAIGDPNEPMYVTWTPKLSKGAISRGVTGMPKVKGNPPGELQRIYRSYRGLSPDALQYLMRNIMKTRSGAGL